MTVAELIKELSYYPLEFEVGYETGIASIELLIGEDGDDKRSGSILIRHQEW